MTALKGKVPRAFAARIKQWSVIAISMFLCKKTDAI